MNIESEMLGWIILVDKLTICMYHICINIFIYIIYRALKITTDQQAR